MQTVSPDFTVADLDPDFVFKGNARIQFSDDGHTMYPCYNASGATMGAGIIVNLHTGGDVLTVVGGTVHSVDPCVANEGELVLGQTAQGNGITVPIAGYCWVRGGYGLPLTCVASGAVTPGVLLYPAIGGAVSTTAGTGKALGVSMNTAAGALVQMLFAPARTVA